MLLPVLSDTSRTAVPPAFRAMCVAPLSPGKDVGADQGALTLGLTTALRVGLAKATATPPSASARETPNRNVDTGGAMVCTGDQSPLPAARRAAFSGEPSFDL